MCWPRCLVLAFSLAPCYTLMCIFRYVFILSNMLHAVHSRSIIFYACFSSMFLLDFLSYHIYHLFFLVTQQTFVVSLSLAAFFLISARLRFASFLCVVHATRSFYYFGFYLILFYGYTFDLTWNASCVLCRFQYMFTVYKCGDIHVHNEANGIHTHNYTSRMCGMPFSISSCR